MRWRIYKHFNTLFIAFMHIPVVTIIMIMQCIIRHNECIKNAGFK